jgi:hypothetical protein
MRGREEKQNSTGWRHHHTLKSLINDRDEPPYAHRRLRCRPEAVLRIHLAETAGRGEERNRKREKRGRVGLEGNE